MKRIFITGFALLALFQTRAQNVPTDSTAYKSRKLKLEEVNLVSSYYKQDGNNSAVTGGIGSEHLTDIANTIDVKLMNDCNLNTLCNPSCSKCANFSGANLTMNLTVVSV